MTSISITEKDYNEENLLYIQASIGELLSHADCSISEQNTEGRAQLMINCPECYLDIIKSEISDKVAEIIAIKYKY